MPSPPQFPPLDYSLLFPDLVNFHIDRNPTFPIYAYLDESTPEQVTEISFLEFGRAAHRVAHALRPSREGPDGKVIMIIANTDTILYHAVVAGLSLAGWVPFLVSPRNPPISVVNMMMKTKCTSIVTVQQTNQKLLDGVRGLIGGVPLSVYELPTLKYAFPKLGKEVVSDPFVPYPALQNRPDLDSPAAYVHSSGSTGFPKPIPISYRIQIQWTKRPLFGEKVELPPPRRAGVMVMPPFHAFGIIAQLYTPMAFLVTIVMYPPRTFNDPLALPVIPTSDNMLEHASKTKCGAIYTVPAFLERMIASPAAINILKTMNAVCYGGGPLPVKVGEALWAAGVKLMNSYGGSEFGPLAMPDPQDVIDGDWMWFRFTGPVKVRWAPQGDGTYELQILSTEEQGMAVENLPDVKGYATSDLFVKHPTKDMYRIIGRLDDVIILSSGEKTVPVPMETLIESSPLVIGAIMFGRERDRVGVIVEPRPGLGVDVTDEKAVAAFRNQIWPVVDEANQTAPTFSRIFKEMILITSQAKPMARTGKGTVQRKGTLMAYTPEINALYDAVEATAVPPDGLAAPLAWTREALEEWLIEHARAISPNSQVDPRADLFAQGFDSLSATYLRNRLWGAFRQSPDPAIQAAATRIPPNIIFESPTIQLLSLRIAALANGEGGQTADFVDQHKQSINAMIEKYSVSLNGPSDGALPGSQLVKPAVVLLTGTTGGLGSFLLSELLKNPATQRVFAFNRPSSTKSIEERQQAAFKDKGLSIDLLKSDKLVYITADASSERCGLSAAQYDQIRNSVTLIIHNAWRLDFNLSLSSFEGFVRASRNLVNLGLDSSRKNNLRFLFTSSVGVAQSWDRLKGPYLEEIQLDSSTAVGMGYGEGKYAAERIIVKSGLHATSLRVGQIVGGQNGSWATSDWFPIIVKSSIALGALPDTPGVVSWLRTEDVASAVLEAAFARESAPPALNIVNPRGARWSDIISLVRRAIIARKGFATDALPIVPFGEWFASVEKRSTNASADELEKIPAIKLLEVFRAMLRGDEAIRKMGVDVTEAGGMANFNTDKAQRVSQTMANMQAVGEVEVNAWVRYWIENGAF